MKFTQGVLDYITAKYTTAKYITAKTVRVEVQRIRGGALSTKKKRSRGSRAPPPAPAPGWETFFKNGTCIMVIVYKSDINPDCLMSAMNNAL